jgi:hypothetical protein
MKDAELMSRALGTALPVTIDGTGHRVGGVIERVIGEVPPPRTHAMTDPASEASAIARRAAKQAAFLSGSLALPPGPLGMLTILPDLYLIWKTQRQMIADLFGLYGRSAELTRTHMLYCLFRHAASHVLRDVVVRTGQRVIVRHVAAGTLQGVAQRIGVTLTKRIAGTAASRWVPMAGAAAVGAYAYWDTMQVAQTAHRLLAAPDETDGAGNHVRPL